MIKTYKIINGNSNVNPDIIFQFAQGGHSKKLFKRSRLDIMKFVFVSRITDKLIGTTVV